MDEKEWREFAAKCPLAKKLSGLDSVKFSIPGKDKQGMSGFVMEIVQAIKRAAPYGSVEIFIQDSNITQIATRKIDKLKVHI